MEPLSQLLLRNLHELQTHRRLLWINPPGDANWRELDLGPGRIQLFCQDRTDWRRLRAAGAHPEYGDFPTPGSAPPEAVLLTLPREKERLAMLAHCAASLLEKAGCLYLFGEIRAGIKSAPGRLDPFFKQVTKLDNARHCVLFRASALSDSKPFDGADYAAKWSIDNQQHALEVRSWPGVFAHGALDPGTSLLLEHLPVPPGGPRVLDFGCGSGVIAAAMLQRNPELDCTLADSNALACRSARATLDANGLQADVIASDGLDGISGKFEMVVTNPPFHARHVTISTLSQDLLAPIRNFLDPGGQFILVANRHLPYRDWLDGLFGSHERVSANQRYHVLRAVNSGV